MWASASIPRSPEVSLSRPSRVQRICAVVRCLRTTDHLSSKPTGKLCRALLDTLNRKYGQVWYLLQLPEVSPPTDHLVSMDFSLPVVSHARLPSRVNLASCDRWQFGKQSLPYPACRSQLHSRLRKFLQIPVDNWSGIV